MYWDTLVKKATKMSKSSSLFEKITKAIHLTHSTAHGIKLGSITKLFWRCWNDSNAYSKRVLGNYCLGNCCHKSPTRTDCLESLKLYIKDDSSFRSFNGWGMYAWTLQRRLKAHAILNSLASFFESWYEINRRTSINTTASEIFPNVAHFPCHLHCRSQPHLQCFLFFPEAPDDDHQNEEILVLHHLSHPIPIDCFVILICPMLYQHKLQ